MALELHTFCRRSVGMKTNKKLCFSLEIYLIFYTPIIISCKKIIFFAFFYKNFFEAAFNIYAFTIYTYINVIYVKFLYYKIYL